MFLMINISVTEWGTISFQDKLIENDLLKYVQDLIAIEFEWYRKNSW
jgi:hypothetical protein